ncbi:3-oxoacyl-[acyl-carrier protein] reductase [Halalkalibacter wakoensis JCM 9140]|uniref:3-oxoacyl-[acyl-carrier protein] reductase n=1 Tax=Halalkalibacter wakoensis JCM 9140 TaxID=1236970 RepID=W4Q8R0_9BACI|nr:SDR family oxidoreductase [Halalkalibacter wakoensis]GAE28068.1 3-oxoacyl-[acyl-carrier protein] reductase [Halalkalibacter wakoensis JCM 9140]
MNLQNKKIVVTGASKGLGLSVVKRLASEGAEIIAHYNSGEISEARNAAESVGVKFTAFQADLSNEKECLALAQKIIECGDIYGLVNNAGICVFKDLFDVKVDDLDLTYAVNFKSVFILTQQIAKHMKERDIKGRIVNFSSISSLSGSDTQVDYCAMKGAINTFTKATAVALGQYGITINAVLPGPIPTKHNSEFLLNDDVKQELFERMPLQSYGAPENIADAVMYFLGEHANWTTGALLQVDGGFMSK